MTTLATLVVKLVGDTGSFRSSIDDTSQMIRNAGKSISDVGGDLTAKVTLPIVGIGTAATVMANQFNEGMANVTSLVPSAAGEIAGLSDDVQQLAVDMGQGTGDMTQGLYQVVSAFGYSGEAMAQLQINAMAAKAGLASTEEAIALTSAVTKGYGDTSATAMQQVADLALTTVQMGQTTFPELAASIGRVTPLAAQLGVSQNELFGVMATGAGVTGNAAEVSTQFRGILQSLMAPTESMKAAFEELNVATGQELIDIYGLEDGLFNVMSIVEESGEPLQKYIGSIEGQTLAMALVGPQADAWSQKTQAMRESAGAAQRAFELQTQGVNAAGFEMQQAAIQTQVMTQQIGQALQPAVLSILPYVQQFLVFIQGLIQRFNELDPGTQKIILGAIGLAAAIGPVLMVIGPMVSGLGVLVGVLGAVVSPVGLVIAGIVALGVAVVRHFGGIEPTLVVFRGAFERAREVVSQVVSAIGNVVNAVFGQIQIFLATHGEEIKSFLASAWQQIGTIIDLALQVIQATIVPIINGIASWIRQHGQEIQSVLGGAWTMISNVIQGALTLIQGILRAALAVLHGDWSGAWDIIKSTISSVWTNIQGIVQGALQILQTVFGPAIDAIRTAISTKWEEITTWFASLPDQMVQLGRDLIQGAINGIAEKAADIKQFIEDLFGDVIAIAKRILGIKSPSTVFADMGGNLVAGFAGGIATATPAAVTAVNAMMAEVARVRPAPLALATVAAGQAGATGGQQGGLFGGQPRGDAWNVTLNIYGNGDPQAVGRAARDGVLQAARAMGLR